MPSKKARETSAKPGERTARASGPHGGPTLAPNASGSATTMALVVGQVSSKPVRTKPMRVASDGAQPTAASTYARGTDEAARAAAQQAAAQVSMQAKMKEDYCTDMLMGGYVQSFVDIFYLTHRNDAAMQSNGNGARQAGFDPAEMEFLREHLVNAEHCKRKGDVPEVLNAYDSLATYCLENGDTKTMIFFYEKCLEIARLVKDQACEVRMLSKIGLGYHSLRDLAKAREYQELQVSIADKLFAAEEDEEARNEAYVQLGRVYVDLASDYERAHNYEESIDFYKKFLDCSSKAKELESIGLAQLKIGSCYNALNQPSNALPFLEAFLTMSRKTSNLDGEGKACAELATAHEKLANKQLSIEFLNHYLTIATKSDNLPNQADACRRLGHIYTAARDFPRAREMQEKNYELMPAICTSGASNHIALNCARINVGAARANDKLGIFLTLVKDDFRGLLEWKNSRTIPTAD